MEAQPTVELLIGSLLAVHVGAGVLALAAALLAASNKKGSKLHRKIGAIFFWSMLVIGVTAIPVTFFRPNPFLFFIALFSFYMAFAGYRRGKPRFQATNLDRFAAVSMIATAVFMIGYGLLMVLSGAGLGWALMSFGGLGVSFGLVDILHSVRSKTHNEKVQVHLSRMLGGTIATVTAVLVQQVTPLVSNEFVQVALWLAPTLVLTPLIVIWQIRIQKTGRYRLLAGSSPKASFTEVK